MDIIGSYDLSVDRREYYRSADSPNIIPIACNAARMPPRMHADPGCAKAHDRGREQHVRGRAGAAVPKCVSSGAPSAVVPWTLTCSARHHSLCAGNLIKLFFRNLKPKLMDPFDGDVLDGMAGCDDAAFAVGGRITLCWVRVTMVCARGTLCLNIYTALCYRRLFATTGIRRLCGSVTRSPQATLQSTLSEDQLHLFHWILDRCLDIMAHSEHNR